MATIARSASRRIVSLARNLLVACNLAFPSVATAQEDSDLRRSFDDVLRDRSGVAPNLAYARVAIARGELRKALAAYERILARDPANEEALAGRARILRELEPNTLRLFVSVGATYQTNPRHANISNSATDDFSYGARVALIDERRALGLRWRTEADMYAIQYTSFHDLDIGSAAARVGPMIYFDNFRRVHAFVGASYNWLARRTFFVEPTVGLNFEIDDLGPFRGVLVRGGYQFIGQHLTTRDGMFVEIIPRFVWPDLVSRGAVLSVSPYWRYNGVVGSGAAVEPFGVPFPACTSWAFAPALSSRFPMGWPSA
jgi:hypothetical protein